MRAMNRGTLLQLVIRAGVAVLLAGLALGCEQRVVSAKGIGSEKYVVKPDPPPQPTRKSRFYPPRQNSPTSKLQRTAPY